MYATDHPDRMTFTRPGKTPPGVKETTDKAAWANVLIGKALADYMKDKLPSQAILDKLKSMSPGGGVIKLGPK